MIVLGVRPSEIVVNLWANDKKIDSIQVSEKDNWQYKFNNLAKYDGNGKRIKYTITENNVSGYKSEVIGYDITNTLKPKKPIDPANPNTNTPTLPVNPGTNMPTLPVINNNGDTSSNTTTNDVVNNVVDGAQTLLPKTKAEKITFAGVVSFALASLAGLVIWKKRK